MSVTHGMFDVIYGDICSLIGTHLELIDRVNCTLAWKWMLKIHEFKKYHFVSISDVDKGGDMFHIGWIRKYKPHLQEYLVEFRSVQKIPSFVNQLLSNDIYLPETVLSISLYIADCAFPPAIVCYVGKQCGNITHIYINQSRLNTIGSIWATSSPSRPKLYLQINTVDDMIIFEDTNVMSMVVDMRILATEWDPVFPIDLSAVPMSIGVLLVFVTSSQSIVDPHKITSLYLEEHRTISKSLNLVRSITASTSMRTGRLERIKISCITNEERNDMHLQILRCSLPPDIDVVLGFTAPVYPFVPEIIFESQTLF
jgi:hypothetical protein